MDILYFSKNPPLAFLKPGAILIPLEVYLVNSPSRPNSRPACPLFPAERGSVSRRNLARPAGMIIETRTPSVRRISLRFTAPHPVSSIALHRQGGAVRLLPSSSPQPPFAVDLLLPSRHHQASIKAKTPAIVHNQGISRQTANFQSGPVPGAATTKPATRSALAAACASHPHPQTANQGRNPCNRA